MLKDLLDNHNCFKLVCGAGNEDIREIEKLVTIYANAGCRFFDVCAKPEVIDVTKKALKNANKINECYICVSVGIDGDPHITKAKIRSELCSKCGTCTSVCIHDAIDKNYNIIKERCLGCGNCFKACKNNAISLESQLIDYNTVLPQLVSKGIDCIEFHAISENEDDVDEKWMKINEAFNGMLCISLDRSELGDKKLIKRVQRMIKNRKPYSTIIQADGIAMSGNNDEYSTTLQAVATAQLFQNAKLPVYIMMSGGTNTKSSELAKLCGVQPHCIAVGSYARKIVKNYLQEKDLLTNKALLNQAINIAKNLINVSLENMNNG